MDFLIDRRLWNQVIKKLSPKTALKVKEDVKVKNIKNECVLEITSLCVNNGFFRKQLLNFKWIELDTMEIIEIEKAILKVLVEKQGLSTKVRYTANKSSLQFIVETYQSQKRDTKIGNGTYASIKNDSFGFVYFIRNKDLYKIGITQNLLNRLNQLKPDEVLNTLRCSNYEELEKELHKNFKDDRIPQTEYFRLTPTQVEEVHQLMTTKANF